MISTPVLAVAACIIFMLLLVHHFGPPARSNQDESPDDNTRDALQRRVERLVNQLAYGDRAQDAAARLLSMGPGILPLLLAHLRRLEQDRDALSPRAQRAVERLMADFGLQAYLHSAEHIASIHRSSPAFPAIVRVLMDVGPLLVGQLMRRSPCPDSNVLVPLFHRFGAQTVPGLLDLLREDPNAIPDDLLHAALPLFAAEPALLDGLMVQCADAPRRRLAMATMPWPLPNRRALITAALDDPDPELAAAAMVERAVALVASHPHQDDALHKALIALARSALAKESPRLRHQAHLMLAVLEPAVVLEALGAEFEDAAAATEAQIVARLILRDDPDPRRAVEDALEMIEGRDPLARRASVRALGAFRGDPRAQERLVALAQDLHDPLGALALVTLARAGLGPLEDLLALRVRAANRDAERLFFVRLAAAFSPAAVQQRLFRLLRTESIRAVRLAALLVAPLQCPTQDILKALGRHRYSPIGACVAPLLWACWPQRSDQVQAALTCEDREVRHAAIITIAALGDAHQGDALLGALEDDAELAEPILNAIEMLGAPMASRLSALARQKPEMEPELGLGRRTQLLEIICRQDRVE